MDTGWNISSHIWASFLITVNCVRFVSQLYPLTAATAALEWCGQWSGGFIWKVAHALHPPSVNPVSCHVKSTWFMLTRKQPPQGACNVTILVNMYTYIFNSLITCILFVFPFCSSGWNEALESHHLQSTAIMNWFLYSLTGRLTLISVLHMIPDDKHFILRLFLFCLCFGSVLSFQQAICTENYEVFFFSF